MTELLLSLSFENILYISDYDKSVLSLSIHTQKHVHRSFEHWYGPKIPFLLHLYAYKKNHPKIITIFAYVKRFWSFRCHWIKSQSLEIRFKLNSIMAEERKQNFIQIEFLWELFLLFPTQLKWRNLWKRKTGKKKESKIEFFGFHKKSE